MRTFRNGACILAACAGLLAAPPAWSQRLGFGSAYEVGVDKSETLSDLAWQHRRESARPDHMTFGISHAKPEVFPGGNLGEERADELGASRAYGERGGWYRQRREQGVPIPAPIVHSPR
jgi:hypothetical protein